MKRKGFTLIELLVVIAIIAILAAILFPVFARARENARKSTCQSNLKQIGTAARMYSQDYDEIMPAYYENTGLLWVERLDPYVKNSRVFVCPSYIAGWATPSPTACGSTNHPPESPFRNKGGITNYAYNAYNESYGETNGVSGSQYLGLITSTQSADAMIKLPAETILVGDGACPRFWGLPYVTNFNADTGNVYKRHMEGANYLFCDGHVKWQKLIKPCFFDATRSADY